MLFKRSIAVLLSILFVCLFFCSCAGKDAQSEKVGFQLNPPSQGEEIAVMVTNKGTIKMRFFDKLAPKAVENFKELSKKGYYNGITFHRVIKDFMIQGGDPTASGAGGESIWGNKFEDEFSPNLLNITGAVAMANSGKNTNGSQFFINYVPPESFKGWDYMQKLYDYYKASPKNFNSSYGGTVDMSKVSNDMKELYNKNGGNPNLDGYYNTDSRGHTVFAQVFEGLDVVKSIDEVSTDSSDKPVEAVVIDSVSIVNY